MGEPKPPPAGVGSGLPADWTTLGSAPPDHPRRLARGPETGGRRARRPEAPEPALVWDPSPDASAEARLRRALAHPGLVPLLDELETPDGLALVEPELELGALEQRLVEGRYRRDEAGTLQLAAELADTLAYLHALRPPVVVRDLRPATVGLDPEGRAWIADLGRATDDPRLALGGGPAGIGVRGYAAPEQLEAGVASPAGDVHALGATVLRLLTGLPPDQIPRRRLAPDLGALSVSAPVAAWVQACMDVDPGARPSAAEARDRALALIPEVAPRPSLRPEARREGAASASVPPASGAPPAPPPRAAPDPAHAAPSRPAPSATSVDLEPAPSPDGPELSGLLEPIAAHTPGPGSAPQPPVDDLGLPALPPAPSLEPVALAAGVAPPLSDWLEPTAPPRPSQGPEPTPPPAAATHGAGLELAPPPPVPLPADALLGPAPADGEPPGGRAPATKEGRLDALWAEVLADPTSDEVNERYIAFAVNSGQYLVGAERYREVAEAGGPHARRADDHRRQIGLRAAARIMAAQPKAVEPTRDFGRIGRGALALGAVGVVTALLAKSWIVVGLSTPFVALGVWSLFRAPKMA